MKHRAVMRGEITHIKDQWVEGFRQGQETAFTELFRELYPAMTLYALKYTGQQAVAEEIAEESFVKAWERRESFSQFKMLCSWLYASIRHAAIDWLRHEEVMQKSETLISERYENSDPTILDHLVQAELLRELGQALNQLPPQQQKIVRAFYIEEKSLREIADQMQLSIHTVKSQKARGLSFLRKMIPFLLVFLNSGKYFL